MSCSLFFAQSRLKPHAINAVYLYQDFLKEGKDTPDDPIMQDFLLACEAGHAIGSQYVIIVPPLDPSESSWEMSKPPKPTAYAF